MAEPIKIIAGVDGGNFDTFIAHMGSPENFGLTSLSRKHAIFSEIAGGTGEVIDVVSDFIRVTSVRLLAADGRMLVELKWPTFAWGGIRPEPLLDRMMNSLQAGRSGSYDFAVSFQGQKGNDEASGGRNADTMTGGGGDDILTGGGGADSLVGGLGDDTLIGGLGADQMAGGMGADIFVFSSVLTISGDRIQDFHMSDVDKIDFHLVDAVKGTPAIDHFHFIGADRFGGNAGELRIVERAAGTLVLGDTDGNARADFSLTLEGAAGLDSSAFVLI